MTKIETKSGASSTLLIVGSGAVSNAWVPVMRAMRLQYRYVPDSAGELLASHLIFHLRWLHQRLVVGGSQAERSQFETFADVVGTLRRDIAQEFTEAKRRREIRLRDEFDLVMQLLAATPSPAPAPHIVTTNWDELIEERVGADRVLALHGTISEPESLYLPSEISEDGYHQALGESRNHSNRLKQATEAAALADRLVLYGIGLSPLDAELGLLLSNGIKQRSQHGDPWEIYIVDPSPGPIIDRVLLYCGPIEIRVSTPEQIWFAAELVDE